MELNVKFSTNSPTKGSVHYKQAIEKALDVHSLAAQDANNGEPSTQATSPGANEGKIAVYCRMLWQKMKDPYVIQLTQEQEIQAQNAARLDSERFDECYTTARRKIDEQNAALQDPAKAAYREKHQAGWELKVFKDRHQVFREAVYPESLQLHYALITFMVIVDATANAVFFAEGAEGLLHGWLVALIAAGMNVVLSFFAGNVLRGVNGSSVGQWLSVTAGIVYALALPSYHLIVGHYRVALMGEQPELATTVAIATFLFAPFAIYDLQTWILVFVGIAFGVSAAVTGYRTDDRLPSYGDVSRRYKAAEQKYNGCKQQYRKDIGKVHDDQCGAVDRVLANAESAWLAQRTSVRKMEQLIASGKSELAEIIAAGIAAIQQYREINSRFRATEPPSYFRHQPQPFITVEPATALNPSDFARWENIKSPSEELLALLQKKAHHTKTRLDELCREKGDELRYFKRIERSVEEEQTENHPPTSMLLIEHHQNKETSAHLH
jgi:hypothetical protein